MSIEPTRARTERAQREAIQRLRGGSQAATGSDVGGACPYAGLVTRAIALSLDALVVNGGAVLVGVVVGLGLSLLHLPSETEKILAAVGGVLWVLWSVAYFVFFWSTTGQTPGSRVMSIAVVDASRRGPLKPRRALLRFAALCVGAAALMAGVLMMLWDQRRRCLQDRLARTLVIYLPAPGPGRPA